MKYQPQHCKNYVMFISLAIIIMIIMIIIIIIIIIIIMIIILIILIIIIILIIVTTTIIIKPNKYANYTQRHNPHHASQSWSVYQR